MQMTSAEQEVDVCHQRMAGKGQASVVFLLTYKRFDHSCKFNRAVGLMLSQAILRTVE
jgi:hypothetical protein